MDGSCEPGHGARPGWGAELLLSTLSHDLRGPLATIASIARTLEVHGGRLDDETRVDLTRRIAMKAEGLGRLVNELLDVTRVDGDEIVLERAPIRVDELVARVVGEIDEAGRVILDAAPVSAAIDPMMTARILTNLVRNALEHAGPGATIWVHTSGSDRGIELVVEDDGVGVPDTARGSLFDGFHPSTSAAGTGFGLVAVARFARLMGGHVEVGDRDGGGARFRVWLPSHEVAGGGAGSAGDVVELPDEPAGFRVR